MTIKWYYRTPEGKIRTTPNMEVLSRNEEKWEKLELGHSARIAEDVIGGVRISTVLLSLDHSFGKDGAPIIFETMIFGGEHDQNQYRACTQEEAEMKHARAVKLVRESLATSGKAR